MKKLLTRSVLFVFLLFSISCSGEWELESYGSEKEETLKQFNNYWDQYDAQLPANPDSAIFYMTRLRDLAEEKGDKVWLAAAYGEIGEVQYAQGFLGKAITNHLKAAELFKELGQLLKLANAYTSIGSIFFSTKDYDAAILYYQQAAEIFAYEGKSYDKVNIYRNLAISYKEKKEFLKAEESLEKSKEIAIKEGLNSFVCDIYITSGSIQFEQGNYGKAREYFMLAADLASKVPDSLRVRASAYNNIGEVYLKEEKLILAEKWLLKALALKQELNEPLFTQTTLNTYGEVLMKMGQYEKAVAFIGSWIKEADTEIVDKAVQDGLSLIIKSLLLASKAQSPDEMDYLSSNFTTYSDKLLTFNSKLSSLSGRLGTVSQKQSVQIAVDKYFIQEQLAEEQERIKWMEYAFIIPIILLIAAAIFVYRNVQKTKKMKKVFGAIDEVLNKRTLKNNS